MEQCSIPILCGGRHECSIMCFFFNDTATTEIYTLSLHDALPISLRTPLVCGAIMRFPWIELRQLLGWPRSARSEEHTSELQSQFHLVCRLLLEKKKTNQHRLTPRTTPPMARRRRESPALARRIWT